MRPFIAPSKSGHTFWRASSGLIQLFVGPTSSFFGVQMNVRCSVRATSDGFDRCRKLLGCFWGLSGSSVPSPVIVRTSPSLSASDPSHQWMRSGVVCLAISVTQATIDSFFTRDAPEGPKDTPSGPACTCFSAGGEEPGRPYREARFAAAKSSDTELMQ